MKTKYLCNDCGYIFCDNDMIQKCAEDYEYTNVACPCGSGEICEIDENDVCPVCGQYHGDYCEWRICYDLLYSDGRGLYYISKEWKPEDTISISLALSDAGRGDTMKSLIWDSGSGVDFVKVICAADDARGDINRNYNIINRITA